MRNRIPGFVSAFLILGFAAQATALTITLDQVLGPGPLSGDIILDFTAAGDGSTATIQIDTTGLPAAEYVKELYFNAVGNPFVVTGVNWAASTPGVDSMTWGVECCQADTDGSHDFLLSFSSLSDRLVGGALYDVLLTGTGLTDTIFDDYGTLSDFGQFRAVARVLVTGGGEYWVGDSAVPEPTTTLLLAVGLFFAYTRRR